MNNSVKTSSGPALAIVFGFFGLKSPGWFWSEDWALPGLALIALWGAGTNMLLYLAPVFADGLDSPNPLGTAACFAIIAVLGIMLLLPLFFLRRK